MDTFAYADKGREKQRLEGLEKRKMERAEEAAARGNSLKAKKKMRGIVASETAWSHQKAQKDRKEERKEKKTRKRVFEKKQKKEQEQKSQQSNGQEMKEEDIDEQDDWAQDEREAKKLRKSIPAVTLASFDDL